MPRDAFKDDVYKAWAALPLEARRTSIQAADFAWEMAGPSPAAGRQARYERVMSVIRPFIGTPLSTDR